MNVWRIVRNRLQDRSTLLHKGGFTMKAPRTVLTVSALAFAAAILLGGVLASAMPKPGKGGGKTEKVDHLVTFDGDIQSDPFVVKLDPNDPFKSVVADSIILTFPATTTGEGCTNTNIAPDWGGYGLPANNPWIGPLSMSEEKGKKFKGNWHVGFNEGINAVGGHINLVVNASAVETKDEVTNTTYLDFLDVQGSVSAFSTPDGVEIDSDQRCLVFTISAMRL